MRITKPKRVFLQVVTLITMSLLVGCLGMGSYHKSYDFEEYNWLANENISFKFRANDTLTKGDIRLCLRYKEELAANNLTLKVRTTNDSTAQFFEEVLNLQLPRKGEHFIESYELLYRTDVVWQDTNSYTLSIRPNKNLQGIVSLNLEIDNAKPLTTNH